MGYLLSFAWLLMAASALGCLYLAYACRAVRRFAERPRPRAAARPPVSLLKPLHGQDRELAENLRSFCRQDYPGLQIVFGVQHAEDAALPVVRRLAEEFPAIDLALVVEAGRRGGNLKVANLQNMLPKARHDLLVIADSDMRVAPNYLAEVTAPFADPAIGLVTCLYRGISSGGFWSDLACLHVNHSFLPQAVVGEAVGAGAGCFGATIALKRATLEKIGGFAAFADELADDHALGAAVRRAGLRVELSPHLVDDVIAEPSLGAMFRHELRWARTIRLIAPLGFLGSIVTYPLPLALLVTALGVLPVAAPTLLAAAFCSRYATIRLTDRALLLPPTPFWLVPIRDVLSFGVFIASFFVRTVAWRGHKFRIGPDGRLILDGDSPA